MLDRSGVIVRMKWSFDPTINVIAHKAALKTLKADGVENATIYSVAPLCFWYSTPEDERNVSRYIDGEF